MEVDRVYVKGREFVVERVDATGKNAIAYIRKGRVIIKIPKRLSRRDAEKAYETLKGRAEKKISRWSEEELNGLDKPRYLEFFNNQELNIMGQIFLIRINESDRKNARASVYDNEIVINLPYTQDQESRVGSISNLVRRTISKHVIHLVRGRVSELNEAYFGYRFGTVYMKDQATRWGSCSQRSKNINLNFRLLLAPQEIMDYVIIHELAHVKESNHSRRFWNLVSSAVPDYKEKARWLRKEGRALGQFGAPNNSEGRDSLDRRQGSDQQNYAQ